MLVELCAGLVLVEQGELELLYLLKVVVEDELLGESGVEVVDGGFCPGVLAGRQGSRGQSSTLLGLLEITLPTRGHQLCTRHLASYLDGCSEHCSQLTEDT